ncbi:hypothetical protein MMC07_004882 [Pseudocyphellaria aurata]|nr:hypothetical protein [Pseudocyphellaria aurata]
MANYLVPILNGASIFGRTVPSALVDKVGRFNMMIVMTTFTSVLILALWLLATGNAALIVFAVLFGIGSGAAISPIKDIQDEFGAFAIDKSSSRPVAAALPEPEFYLPFAGEVQPREPTPEEAARISGHVRWLPKRAGVTAAGPGPPSLFSMPGTTWVEHHTNTSKSKNN